MISKEALNRTAHQILGAAIDVHAAVGPGVMERAYFECLARELHERGLRVDAHVPIPLVYRDIRLDCVYRADLVVENCVVVEVKALETVAPIHLQQLYTYLRLGDYRLGLLLNFGGATLKEGIRRVVNRFPDE
jgi:GxxExxY protein